MKKLFRESYAALSAIGVTLLFPFSFLVLSLFFDSPFTLIRILSYIPLGMTILLSIVVFCLTGEVALLKKKRPRWERVICTVYSILCIIGYFLIGSKLL